MRKEGVETLMLAGGLGKRLEDITGGNRPKCFVELQHNYRAIDYVLEQLNRIGIVATWSADNYYYQYQKVLKGSGQRLLWQKPGGVVEAVQQPGGTVLAIALDCIFPFKDIPDMIAHHKPGTVTWAVTRHEFPGMDSYKGMDVLDDGAIVGRDDKSVIRAPVTLIDTNLLKHFTSKAPSNGEGENLYYDVLARIERENARRVKAGKSSILNAYFLSGPVIDFGTPARLLELKEGFQGVLRETNS